MSDSITNCNIYKTPSGTLDHYEVTFLVSISPLPFTVTVLPSEMTNPSDMTELKTLACSKASTQKAILELVITQDSSLDGPVSL